MQTLQAPPARPPLPPPASHLAGTTPSQKDWAALQATVAEQAAALRQPKGDTAAHLAKLDRAQADRQDVARAAEVGGQGTVKCLDVATLQHARWIAAAQAQEEAVKLDLGSLF